ncbi:Peptide deformylase [subsurface metagenome]
MLKIETGQNNPILRKKSLKIKEINDDVRKLAKDMIETINKSNGIGLSACQVSKNIQMFVIIKELSKKQIFINPEIVKISKKSSIVEEGCLSVPNVYLPIKRAMSLKIKAFDENNKQFNLKATDLLAQAIQHELDHLNGILITDKNT